MMNYDVLDVRVSAVSLGTIFPTLRDMVKDGRKGYVCVAPVSTIVQARRDPAYRAVVNAATIVTPDGMPLVWLGRLSGLKKVGRTYGPDLMLKVCDEGRADGLRHFFYGGNEATVNRLVKNLQTKLPGLAVAGTIAPPYTNTVQPLSEDVIRVINDAKPDILWVGLGSPKQDFWMNLNRAALNVPVMIGTGAAFDFHAGTKPQAPRWMQSAGLEWMFRLVNEPRRLWRRYIIGNTLFVWWLVKDSFSNPRNRR